MKVKKVKDEDEEEDEEEEEDDEEDKEDEEEDDSDTEDDVPPKKKPAAATAMKAMKAMNANCVVKKGATGEKKDPAIPFFGSEAQAVCPKKGSGPVDYKHGRIYTSEPRNAFRVIRRRGKYATERQAD